MQASKIKIIIIYGSVLSLCVCVTNALAPRPRVRSNDRQPTDRNRIAASLPSSRRDALRHAFLLAPVAVATAGTVVAPGAADALEGCRPKSRNCIRTAWTAPSSVSSSTEAAKVIRDVLDTYPQKGQGGADCGGWRIVDDALDAEAGVIVLEYKSCVGPAALAINLGRPFVDDLKLELGGASSSTGGGGVTVEVRSSSRMGSSDLFVNRKRLEYLGRKLKEMGWNIPNPKYGYEK